MLLSLQSQEDGCADDVLLFVRCTVIADKCCVADVTAVGDVDVDVGIDQARR
jgi:hypothetical protein